MPRHGLIFTAVLLAFSGIFAPDAWSADISVPMTKQSPAALFEFNGYTWIVVKDKVPVDLNLLKKTAGKSARQITEIPHKSATILRIKPAANTFFLPRTSGNLFIAEASAQKPKSPRGYISKIVKKENLPRRLFISGQNLAKPITFTDPASGFEVKVVMSLDTLGIKQPLFLPEFALLPSAKGLAVAVFADNIEVSTTAKGAEVFKVGQDILADAVMPIKDDFSLPSSPLDMENKDYVTGDAFRPAYKKALLLPVMASPEDINEARLAAANFFLANELYPEALGAIARIEKTGDSSVDKDSLLAIKGAADFMLGRKEKARASFAEMSPKNDIHLAFWQAAAKGDLQGMQKTFFAIKNYPEPFKNKLALTALDLADDEGNEAALTTFLEMLSTGDKAYYKGRQNELLKAYDAAKNEYKEALLTASDKVKTKAAYRLAELDMKADMALGSAPDIRALFGIYKAVAEAYPNTALARTASKKAHKLFADLYLNGKARSLSKVAAVALFTDFAYLLPKDENNPDGQKMRLDYIDRLVALDLLDDAQKALTAELKNYASPDAAPAALYLRLAVIHGIKGDFAAAKKALSAVSPEKQDRTFFLVKQKLSERPRPSELALKPLTIYAGKDGLKSYKTLDADMQKIAAFKTELAATANRLEESVFNP